MARQVEIIQHLWCDPCMEETPDGDETRYVEAVREIPLVFGAKGKSKVLAVCELHDKEVVQPLEEWYRRLAQENPDQPRPGKVRTPKPPTSEESGPVAVACPICNKPYAFLGGHWRDVHQAELQQTLEQYRGEPTPYPCPKCPLAFGKPQGLGVHVGRIHKEP